MAPPPRSVTDTELLVLKALWREGRGSVRHIQEVLEAEGHTWAYTTVQTLLNRLEGKGHVTSTKAGRAYEFRALVSRDELLGQELDDLAARVCEGAALPLVMNLVRGRRFSAAEIRRFRELVDELEQAAPEKVTRPKKR